MIVGLEQHPAGECFRELDDALVALGRGDVLLNAHTVPAEETRGKTVWHFENQPHDYPLAKEVWTFSKRQAEATGWKYVPVGWHPSMERFTRAPVQDIDVVHVGCLNERRKHVLEELAARGLAVTHIPPGIYGKERDAILARAKLCVVPLYYPDGVFCSLRATHLTANDVPGLFELAPEMWSYVAHTEYERLAGTAEWLLPWAKNSTARDIFRNTPLELPS